MFSSLKLINISLFTKLPQTQLTKALAPETFKRVECHNGLCRNDARVEFVFDQDDRNVVTGKGDKLDTAAR